MQSEIHNKYQSEDRLTGNVFGVLRYSSNFGIILGKVLQKVQFDNADKNSAFQKCLNEIEEQAVEIQLWKHRDAEIDVVIQQDNTLFAIEVKEKSGLSNHPEGENQLAKYARLLRAKYGKKKKIWMVLLAPQDKAFEIFETTKNNMPASNDKLGYLTWETFYNVLKDLQGLEDFRDKLIASDLTKYLEVRGFAGFIKFPIDQYNQYKNNFSQTYEFY